MIPNQYAFLTGCLLFFIPWTYLFYKRKDLRKAMLIMGVIGAFGSVANAHYETIDWWRPLTITGTRIGVEDYILGFSNAGIATVLYVELFHKRLYHRRVTDHSKGLTYLAIFTCLLLYSLFHYAHAGSFLSCTIALSVFSAVMVMLRRDLFTSSFINGLLMVIVAAPIYYILIILSPHIIQKTYIYPLQPHVRILGVPVQEFIFYFVFGFMVALMYEYWQGLRLRQMSLARIRSKN